MASCILWDRNYWTDPDFEGCGAVAKSLYVYFCGSPQTNILGICKASMRRIKEETEFTETQITAGVARLVQMGKMEVDPALNLYWVKGSLKRERNFSQDWFFKGVVNEILKLQDNPITRSLVSKYAPVLASQKIGKRYNETIKAQLMAFIKKLEGPCTPLEGPLKALKDKDQDQDKDLDLLSLQEEEESIASIVPSVEKALDDDAVALVIGYLNAQAGKHFSVDSKPNRDFVSARLKTHTMQDCFEVIDKKVAEWKGTDNDKYLRPETLFNATKFESYHNQASGPALKAQKAAAAASKTYVPRY